MKHVWKKHVEALKTAQEKAEQNLEEVRKQASEKANDEDPPAIPLAATSSSSFGNFCPRRSPRRMHL